MPVAVAAVGKVLQYKQPVLFNGDLSAKAERFFYYDIKTCKPGIETLDINTL